MIVIKIRDENNEFGSEQENIILEFLNSQLGIEEQDIKLTVEESDFDESLYEDASEPSELFVSTIYRGDQ